MTSIDPPRTTDDYPDRDLDCQMAAERFFQAMVEAYVAAGWREDEIARAIEELARNHRMAMEANAATEAQIREARLIAGNKR